MSKSKSGLLFSLTVILSISLTVPYAFAEADCFNRGVVSKVKVDRKEKKSFSGDIKSIRVTYDYESSMLSGTISFNKIPTAKTITTLSIGEGYSDGTCSNPYETYLMTGWNKKFKRDSWNYTVDKTWLGKLTITDSDKTSLSFEWTQATLHGNSAVTENCVSVKTDGPATFYKSQTTCIGTSGILTCDGPGWVNGTTELDFLTNFAFAPGRELDSFSCRYPMDGS